MSKMLITRGIQIIRVGLCRFGISTNVNVAMVTTFKACASSSTSSSCSTTTPFGFTTTSHCRETGCVLTQSAHCHCHWSLTVKTMAKRQQHHRHSERRHHHLARSGSQIRVLVDMDGVLCDFEQHFLNQFRKRYPENKYVSLDQRRNFYLSDDYNKVLDTDLWVRINDNCAG